MFIFASTKKGLRLKVAKELGFEEIPMVYLKISDPQKEKRLNIRLNKNASDWDYDLLGQFDETFLSGVGFSSEELDDIFDIDILEQFDPQKELEKFDIKKIKTSIKNAEKLFQDAVGCLRNSEPKHHTDCEYCTWLKYLNEFD